MKRTLISVATRRAIVGSLLAIAMVVISVAPIGASDLRAFVPGPSKPAALALVAHPTEPDEQTCSFTYYENDKRLGPAQFPNVGEDGQELLGYRRTGNLTAEKFLALYFRDGSWVYPPAEGYVISPGGHEERARLDLYPGQKLDRYGSEYGAFLSPEGLPYSARSIPPQNLDGTPAAGCNYHAYRVVKEFAVEAGPIAAWFGQPGGGIQFQLDGQLVPDAPTTLNVMWLVANDYLAPTN